MSLRATAVSSRLRQTAVVDGEGGLAAESVARNMAARSHQLGFVAGGYIHAVQRRVAQIVLSGDASEHDVLAVVAD